MLLIDGDPCIYACGFASQKNHHDLVVENDETGELKEVYTEELSTWKRNNKGWSIVEKTTKVEPMNEDKAKLIFRTAINAILEKTEAEHGRQYRMFLTMNGGNFRDSVATIKPYKGNRDKSTRPVHYHMLRNYALDSFKCDLALGIEADDAISIHAACATFGKDPLIVSIDKDLDQIVGNHYNYTIEDDTEAFYYVDPKQSTYMFVLQWLAGDATDNIPGLPKVGVTTAAKLMMGWDLTDRVAVATQVAKLYDAAYGTSPEGEYEGQHWAATETAQLIYMLKRPGEFWTYDAWIRGEI